MTRDPKRMSMRNLAAYLEKHQVSLNQLARATGRKANGIHNGLRRGQMSYEFCLMCDMLFRAEGWDVPKNLFVASDGTDCYALPKLHRLSDGKIVPALNQHDPRSKARCITHRYLSPQQLDPRKDTRMARLSPSAIQRFNLRFDPFFNEVRCADDVWVHSEFKQCLQAVERAARLKDMLFVIGEVGCGKTTVKITFIESRPDNVVVIQPLSIGKRNLNDNNLLDAIIHDLSGETERGKAIPSRRESKARMVLDMLQQLQNNGKIAVLVIDEAQRLPKDCLRDLKVLHEMQEGYRPLLGIILFGQNESLARINDSRIREFTERCSLFQWKGLNGKTTQYLDHKISRAGGNVAKMFDAAAIKEIETTLTSQDGKVKYGPYPLELNAFVNKALNLADHTGESRVSVEIVDRIRPIELRPEAR